MNWINYCADCPRIILPTSEWRRMTEEQQRLFYPSTGGRCNTCYQRNLRDLHKQRRGEQIKRRRERIKNTRTTFCAHDGCWLIEGEDCPACEYRVINERELALTDGRWVPKNNGVLKWVPNRKEAAA